MTCLPVHSRLGFITVGGGIVIECPCTHPPPLSSSAKSTSAEYSACCISSAFKNVSRLVSCTPATMWSWINPRSGDPSVGTVYC